MNINPDENKIIYIPVTNILPSPYQPRTSFDMTSLRELAQSIKTYGILNPVTVRIINGRTYELVSGERRWRAAKLAGLENIPAITVNVNDNDAAIIALVENLQRQDLNFFEEAEGYNNIMEDYNITQEELAEKESFVIIGRAADYILKDYDNVISVNIQAPFETCVKAVMKQYNVDDKEAQRIICKTDRERTEYYEYHTGNAWNDELNYDISLNTARISWEKCVQLIKDYIKIKFEE